MNASLLNRPYLLHEDQTLENLFRTGFKFRRDRELSSPATSIMFSNEDLLGSGICLKMWLSCNNGLYNTEDREICTQYTLEGLEFNRRFAPDVYYGIVPVYSISKQEIICGPLIREPVSHELASDQVYALVMKRLDENLRLDYQLSANKLGNRSGMEFLACQVAEMHRGLDKSPLEFGLPEGLSTKLQLNTLQFGEALRKRMPNQQILIDSATRENDMPLIRWVPKLLAWLSETHRHSFIERHQSSHIKRCHGDLKTTNLWFYPSEETSQPGGRLIPLDCIDFKPEFCNIDTLGDVAMLAIDLETRLWKHGEHDNAAISGQELAQHFLQAYLEYMGESESTWPLLEYYMTEKAMVCAYMSILYDKLPTLGGKYLKVVVAHTKELVKYLPSL